MSSLGDQISSLPIDQSVPSHNEIRVVNSLFPPEQVSNFQKLLNGTRMYIVRFLLFIVFSSPLLDELVKKFIATESVWTVIVVKAILFVLCDFIISNVQFARKDN